MLTKTTALLLLSLLSLALLVPVSARAQAPRRTASGVLLDNTGSLRSQLPDVLALGRGVVRRVRARGPVALYSFTSEGVASDAVVTTGSGWGEGEQSLTQRVGDLSTVPGQTRLLDAIASLAQDLQAKASADKDAGADKIIILITDGEDRMHPRARGPYSSGSTGGGNRKKKVNGLIEALKGGGIKVYAVGLVRELDDTGGLLSQSRRKTAEDFLKKLAKETGGRVVFPKGKKLEVEAVLDELFAP